MTKRDLIRFDKGRYSFSIAWFGDGGLRLTWVRLGPQRFALDVSRIRIRFERY